MDARGCSQARRGRQSAVSAVRCAKGTGCGSRARPRPTATALSAAPILSAQTHFILDKIDGALQSLGGSLRDVVRTRVYLHRADDWEPVTRVHGERFAGVLPANTLVEAGVIGDEYGVEIEAEAVLSDSRSRSKGLGGAFLALRGRPDVPLGQLSQPKVVVPFGLF